MHHSKWFDKMERESQATVFLYKYQTDQESWVITVLAKARFQRLDHCLFTMHPNQKCRSSYTDDDRCAQEIKLISNSLSQSTVAYRYAIVRSPINKLFVVIVEYLSKYPTSTRWLLVVSVVQ
jgi:hypothetical protein